MYVFLRFGSVLCIVCIVTGPFSGGLDQSASEVIQLYVPELRLSRALRIGMVLRILLQIVVPRAL